MGAPPSPANEGMQLYSTPAHEGLQLADGNSYAYGPGAPIEPDSAVPPSAITEHKYDEPPLPAYAGRTICGLAARVFWTIVGVAILLLVIAAAVGGGVGGSQAARHAKEAANASPPESSSVSPTAPSTSSPIVSPSQSPSKTSSSAKQTKTSSGIVGATPVSVSGVIDLDCPDIDGTTYNSTVYSHASYSITCSSNIDAADIGRTIAPTINACMEDCADYAKGECVAIVFIANMTLATSISGNCFFKNVTSGLHTGTYKLQAAAVLD